MTLSDRLLRELKANAAKSAVLGVLLLVGLYFWVPPLWKVVAGPSTTAAAEIIPEAAPSPEVAPETTGPAPPKGIGWQEAERIRAEDDLFRSADAAALQANAFVFDGRFLPIDVEFGEVDPKTLVADESDPGANAKESGNALAAEQAEVPAPLTLKSTLIGSRQRVAIINDRAYAEGTTVSVAGKSWTLLNVEPRRVLLDGDGGTLELRIAPFTPGQIGL